MTASFENYRVSLNLSGGKKKDTPHPLLAESIKHNMLDAGIFLLVCFFSRNNMQVNGLRRGQREEEKLEYFNANFCCVSMAIAN